MIWARSAAFAVWFYVGTVLTTVLGLPVILLRQQRVMAYARLWARAMLWGLRWICGIRWEVSGLEHLPAAGPALLASMHQSAFDTLIWIKLAPRFSYVFKSELGRVPIFGLYLTASGMIPVDRSGGASALRAMLRATDHAVSHGRQIVIFPEGTRVAPGQSVALLPGVAALAARSGLPVIPVVTDSGRLWGRKAFRKRPGLIRIAMLPPLPPGLPREAILTRLAALYADAPGLLSRSVDNSVSAAAGSFSNQPS